MSRVRLAVWFVGFVAIAATAGPRQVEAGCGCDHPPPVRGQVYPRFGSAGDVISIYSEAITEPAKCVYIGWEMALEYLPTSEPNTVVVKVPEGIEQGPQAITIYDVECRRAKKATAVTVIPESAFTGLPPTIQVAEGQGTFFYDDIMAAVDADGNLLVPFDLSGVRRATQFYVTILDVPLRFEESGVNYYNRDGYNMKLFQYLVSGPEDYQWGPFYGTKVGSSADPQNSSDMIEYWRHEFETYAVAHAAGGTHEVGADGLHPDGTLHVDHDNMVLAIDGHLGVGETVTDLTPGAVQISVAMGQLFTDGPILRSALTPEQEAILDGNLAEVITFSMNESLLSITKSLKEAKSSLYR